MIKLLDIKPSPIKHKKYRVSFIYRNKLATVDFGDNRYDDYTTHKDKERRDNYRRRHQHTDYNNPLSPAFWSWRLLWGDSTNLVTNIRAL